MSEIETTAQAEKNTLDYARRGNARSGLFAGWYTSIGALNILFALVMLAIALLGLLVSLQQWMIGPSGAFQFPMVVVILSLFAIVASGFILVGSVGSFWRASWSLKLVRAGLAGDLVFCIGFAIDLVRYGNTLTSSAVAMLTTIAFLSIGWLSFAIWAYSNLRADFYFKSARDLPRQPIVPITMPEPTSPVIKPKSAGTFEIRGIDSATQQRVRLTSRAPTEALARKFALTMGLDEQTLEIAAIADE